MAKKPVTEIGETVPRTLKFGIIVAVAIFWVDFIRSAFIEFVLPYAAHSLVLSNLIIAILATIVGYLILLFYRRIYFKLKKAKVEV